MVIKTINKNTGKIGMQIEVFNSKDMCYLKKMCPQKYYKWIVLNK